MKGNMNDYDALLERKKRKVTQSGFDLETEEMNPMLFDFQKFCVKKMLKLGKGGVFAGCGCGKEQPYSEPVLTPNGFVKMGDLKVGDFVIARDGKPTKVLSIHEQGVKDVYKVEFSDGTNTRCGLNHLWNVKTLSDVSSHKENYRTFELVELLKDYKKTKKDKRCNENHRIEYKYSIPVNDAVEFESKDWNYENLDPYILGVLIGDGCISQGNTAKISKPNEELRKKVIERVQYGDVVSDYHSNGLSFSIKNAKKNKKSGTSVKLIELGLMGCKSVDKFIPKEYLYAPIDVRKDLLQGLIDTDGHLRKECTFIEYSTSSEKLKDDVCFLARSLGYMVRSRERYSYYDNEGKRFRSFVVYIYKSNTHKLKKITNIELVGKEQQRCIYVDNEEHLYLTNDFVVTHNTVIQLEWAHQVAKHENKPVLVLAPLSVSKQTIVEGRKFGYEVVKYNEMTDDTKIAISNYEQLENIDVDRFVGIVLDESSILKNYTGYYKNEIIKQFKNTRYKLCCSATPSPNDLNEIGNHSEFLDILDSQDMRSKWFVREEGMNNYRLKGHAKADFYGWIASWAIIFENPADIGFIEEGKKFILPQLNYVEHRIDTEPQQGYLFSQGIVNATNFNAELRKTKEQRLSLAAKLARETDGQVLIWVKQNEEGEILRKLLPEAIEVKGSDKDTDKEQRLIDFAQGKFRILISKAKICGYGMNFQTCNTQIFVAPDFSFEDFYQQVRRSYRFGQGKDVNIHLIVTDSMQNTREIIQEKQRKFEEMQREINKNVNQLTYGLLNDYEYREYKDENVFLMKGDTTIEIKRIPDNSVDLIVFSPPFSSLFTYSNYIHDMGNNESHEEFFKQYAFLLKELYRILKPGRLMCCHTKDLGVYKNSSGYTGMYDFTGEHTRHVLEQNFKLHSKITIWTDPVLEMQRTKTQRLLYKQVTSDSSKTGVGMAEYITIFKKWEGNEEEWEPITNLNKENFPLEVWQKWASPVWMDIRRTDVLNGSEGTEMGDEKHIAPLQLEVINRLVNLWSNEGEVVFTPFLGIGSEVYMAVKNKRKGIGCELKDSYFDVAVKNIKKAEFDASTPTLFDELD